jgi:uncharacterized protein (DUF58 family)
MTREELVKNLRTIELKSKGLSSHVFSGNYKSAFKGRGMSFSEVRDYQIGDEVRTIDWNVTARYNSPYVKVFEEERELNVMLLLDLSASIYYGTEGHSKFEKSLELAATLAFSALENNDKVGAILFSNEVETYIPAKKGRDHVRFLLDKIIDFKQTKKGTQIRTALKTLRNTQKKRSICFLISDFQEENLKYDELHSTRRMHDLIAVKISDPGERQLSIPAFYQLVNPETGKKTWVNGFSAFFKRNYQNAARNESENIEKELKLHGVPLINLASNQDLILPLKAFFNRRK